MPLEAVAFAATGEASALVEVTMVKKGLPVQLAPPDTPMASATITPQIFRIFIGPLLKVKIDWLILESTTVALFIVLQLSLKCYTSSQSSSGIFCIACNFFRNPFLRCIQCVPITC